MASNSRPCPVPEPMLRGLFMVVEHLQSLDQCSLVSRCPHHAYGSTQLFVDHIFWYLEQDEHYKDIDTHHGVIGCLLVKQSLCSRCRNLMISSPALVIRMCSDPRIVSQFNTQIAIYNRYFLFFRLVDHPRMAKVVSKIFKKSESASHWDSMYKMMEVVFLNLAQDDAMKCVQSLSVAYSEFIGLRVKEGPFLPYLPECQTDNKVVMTEMRKEVKQRANCSSIQCGKSQSDSKEEFKLCGGCKLTYYCCRSCQKRAWPQHKPICGNLRRLYKL